MRMQGSCTHPPPSTWPIAQWRMGQCVLYFSPQPQHAQSSVFNVKGAPTSLRLALASLYVLHAGLPQFELPAAEATSLALQSRWSGHRGPSDVAARVSVWIMDSHFSGAFPDAATPQPQHVRTRIGRTHLERASHHHFVAAYLTSL
jgi:hypothetical protein